MTVITHRPLSDATDSLLRFAMRADATLCAGAGLLIAMTADPLARLTGLPATAEWLSGAALVAYGALLYLLAAVGELRRIGIGIVVANLVFAATVLVVVLVGWLALTAAGTAMGLTAAAVTLCFAYVQYLGVRRLPA